MSTIRRSLHSVTGDLTVSEGDVVIGNKDSGLVLTNQSEDQKRVTVTEDAGQTVLEIDDV